MEITTRWPEAAKFRPLLAARSEVQELITQYALDVLRLYWSSKSFAGHFGGLRTNVLFLGHSARDTHHDTYHNVCRAFRLASGGILSEKGMQCGLWPNSGAAPGR